MHRRFLAALLSAIVVIVGSVVGPAYADASAPTTAYALSDPQGEPGMFDSAAGSWAVKTTATGGLSTGGTRTVSLEPPSNGPFTLGRITLSPGGSPDEPVIRYDYRLCRSTNTGASGYIDVREVTYDSAGSLQAFAADLSLNCGQTAPTVQLRYNSTVPWAGAASTGVTTANTLVGQPVTVTTTLRNAGTVTLHPGVPVVDQGSDAPQITAETCSAAALDPGQSCAVTVSTNGPRTTVSFPLPEIDNLAQVAAPAAPALTAEIRVTIWARPGPVASVRTWPAADGIGLAWTDSEPYASYYKVERSTAGGAWEVLSSDLSGYQFADTTAPTGKSSVYRVTPASEGGFDPAGAAESAVTTPLPAWSAPAGAQTYASVDGAGMRPASVVNASGGRVSMYSDYQHAGLSLGPILWRTWSTPTTVTLNEANDGWGNVCWYAADSDACLPITGSMTVQRAVVKADGTPVELAAVIDGTHSTASGATVPVHAIVVLNSLPAGLPPYLVTSEERITAQVSNGSDQAFPVTLRNIGGMTGTPTTKVLQSEYVIPEQSPAWVVSSSCLGRPLAPGAQCATTAGITIPFDFTQAVGPLTAVVAIGLGTGQAAVTHLNAHWRDRWVAPVVSITVPRIVRASAAIQLIATDPQAGDAVTVHCRLDGGPFVDCTSPWSPTGLSNGPHTVVAYATDQAQNMSDWVRASFSADTQGPVTRLFSPAAGSPVVLGPTAWVAWDTSDVVGVSSIQARSRRATPFTAMGAATIGRCCLALRTNSVTSALAPGAEQCWSARAVDLFGQWGAWSPERCVVRPLDDRWMTSRGFVLESSYTYGYWWHTATRTGATLSLKAVRARQVGLLVSVCPTCGGVDVYVGGVRQGRISLCARRARSQVVLWLPRQVVERRGTLVVRTTSARKVVIDGVITRHL